MSSATCPTQSTCRFLRLALKLLILGCEHVVVRSERVWADQSPNLVADQLSKHRVEARHDASPFATAIRFVRIHIAASSGCMASSIHAVSIGSGSPFASFGS